MELQCFEIQIKTEADSNEYPHDDMPSTGMFAVSDEQVHFHVYCICFDISVIMRPSSLGGGCILRRTLSVCLSVRPSVHPSRYRCHR